MTTHKLYLEQFKELLNFLIQEDNVEYYKLKYNKTNNFIFLLSDDLQTSLYVETLNNNLIIRLLSIKNKHSGIGSNILKWLEMYTIHNNYNAIIISSILTREMINLALKYKYKPMNNCICSANNILYGDYIKILS